MKKNVRIRKEIPEPTLEDPYAQVEFVWNLFSEHHTNKSTKENKKNNFLAYKKYLTETENSNTPFKKDTRFYLKTDWDNYSVLAAEQFWLKDGYAPRVVNRMANELATVISMATELGLTSVENIIRPKAGNYQTTSKIEPYTDHEIDVIRRVIRQGIDKISGLIFHYERKGIGADPRKNYKTRSSEDPWKIWDNMVWFFENVLNCKKSTLLLSNSNLSRSDYDAFRSAIKRHHGGLKDVWQKLGVPSIIDRAVIGPLVLKLALETGLNPSSIYNLKRDCFRESHDLTKLPYIRYYKERSTGEKELHIALFDSDDGRDLYLTENQAKIIQRTINLILDLTEPLVASAAPEDREYLLLAQSRRRDASGDYSVKRIEKLEMANFINVLKKKLKSSDFEDSIFALNLVRFRATKITQMVRDGHDFFRIQAAVGHASVKTTMQYVGESQIMPMANREIEKTLIQIRKNTQEFLEDPKPYASAESSGESGYIYKGILADCKNVFDPPEFVTKMKDYKKGKSCAYWNMCLFCKNVIITHRHLPILMNYANSIKVSHSTSGLAQLPNTAHYERTYDVLVEIFKEFPEKDLLWAREAIKSMTAGFYIDGPMYKGVIKDAQKEI